MFPTFSTWNFDVHATAVEDEGPPPNPTLVSGACDIDHHVEGILQAGDPAGKQLTSDKQALLGSIRDKIGTRQVTASHLSFALAWLLEVAIDTELLDKWKEAYELIG